MKTLITFGFGMMVGTFATILYWATMTALDQALHAGLVQ